MQFANVKRITKPEVHPVASREAQKSFALHLHDGVYTFFRDSSGED